MEVMPGFWCRPTVARQTVPCHNRIVKWVMMKITSVEYKRTFNMGNYESLAVALKADVNEGDVVADVLSSLAAEVRLWKTKGGK